MKKLKPSINNRKKVGIITLIGNYNFGNRLQNYALQETIKNLGFECLTLKNQPYSNTKKYYFLRVIKNSLTNILTSKKQNDERIKNFEEFDKQVNFYHKKITVFNLSKTNFDYYVVGSDQVWNPYFGGLREVDLLTNIDPQKRISYSASFGIDEIPDSKIKILQSELKQFKSISVREVQGKQIIEKILGRNDVEVVLDPTMLISAEKWENISKKPKQLTTNKFILNYFLGNLSEQRTNEIIKFAKENNCEIINILDKNSPFYNCGPAEFLYLEKNAFLICTDSFHSSVFAILFNRPFIVYDREEKNLKNMKSRIDTLLETFDLQKQKYNGKLCLNCDYNKANKILKKEKNKAIDFLKKALDIKGNDQNE